MTWIHRVHRCAKPNRQKTAVHNGDVWRCDDCDQHWQATLLGWVRVAWPPKEAG